MMFEKNADDKSNLNRLRTIGYWIFTSIAAFEMAAGGIWDLLRIEYVRVIFTQLGYPLYLLTLLGIWKIHCAFALMLPRLARIKEWAYAGAIFTYTGAAFSHFAVGEGFHKAGAPLVLAVFTLLSYGFRPSSRRLVAPDQTQEETPILIWILPIAIVVIMLIVSFVTLPKGPPPS